MMRFSSKSNDLQKGSNAKAESNNRSFSFRYEDGRMHRDQDDDEPIQRGGDPYDDDEGAG